MTVKVPQLWYGRSDLCSLNWNGFRDGSKTRGPSSCVNNQLLIQEKGVYPSYSPVCDAQVDDDGCCGQRKFLPFQHITEGEHVAATVDPG